jgi:hypothetical protein
MGMYYCNANIVSKFKVEIFCDSWRNTLPDESCGIDSYELQLKQLMQLEKSASGLLNDFIRNASVLLSNDAVSCYAGIASVMN